MSDIAVGGKPFIAHGEADGAKSGSVSGRKRHLNCCYLDMSDVFNADKLTRILFILEKGPSRVSV
ncbi:MAG: hypothetical protein CSA81_10390 [Acidobacteria bacterium]|nr:MAG: hypothetical protein CSA81_10390 [Acidobacteriota bacterium]